MLIDWRMFDSDVNAGLMNLSKGLNKFSFERISAVVGLVAMVIGAVVGGSEFLGQRKAARE